MHPIFARQPLKPTSMVVENATRRFRAVSELISIGRLPAIPGVNHVEHNPSFLKVVRTSRFDERTHV